MGFRQFSCMQFNPREFVLFCQYLYTVFWRGWALPKTGFQVQMRHSGGGWLVKTAHWDQNSPASPKPSRKWKCGCKRLISKIWATKKVKLYDIKCLFTRQVIAEVYRMQEWRPSFVLSLILILFLWKKFQTITKNWLKLSGFNSIIFFVCHFFL